MGHFQPSKGLRIAILGIVLVAERESGARTPNVGGISAGEGGKIFVGARLSRVEGVREGGKLGLERSVLGG